MEGGRCLLFGHPEGGEPPASCCPISTRRERCREPLHCPAIPCHTTPNPSGSRGLLATGPESGTGVKRPSGASAPSAASP